MEKAMEWHKEQRKKGVMRKRRKEGRKAGSEEWKEGGIKKRRKGREKGWRMGNEEKRKEGRKKEKEDEKRQGMA